jgi:hypothetical protein
MSVSEFLRYCATVYMDSTPSDPDEMDGADPVSDEELAAQPPLEIKQVARGDGHYHANHIDAPARSSKAAARKDAKRLRLQPQDFGITSAEDIRFHGPDFPLILRCFNTDCPIIRA